MASNAAPGERRVSPAAAPVTPPSPLERLRRFADAEPLLVQTLVGVFVGVLLGAGLHSWVGHPLAAASAAGRFLALPGFLFMSALRACVGPLIAGSAFAGVLSVSQSCSAAQAKALARRTLLLYLCSMLSAVCVGILCMSLFNPGCGVELGAGCGAPAAGSPPAPPHAVVSSADALLGTLASLVPPNVFAALANGNVLGVLSVSIAAALAVSASGGGERALAAAASFNAVVATLVGWILACTPVCIASLIAAQIAATCRPLSLLSSLSAFVCVYLLGLLLHAGVTIPLALRLLAGVSPREVYRGAAPALATVFATDSSSATLPVTLMCCKARLRLPPHVVDFVIPLGTTVNMDGTALYEAVAVLFIAQVHGVALGAAGTLVVALTATLAAVGAPALPSAGLVTMLMVLQAVGLIEYAGDISVLLALDFILDRCRSVVNVIGDVAVCVIVDALSARDAGGAGDGRPRGDGGGGGGGDGGSSSDGGEEEGEGEGELKVLLPGRGAPPGV